jgi:type VI secretion system protein VasG
MAMKDYVSRLNPTCYKALDNALGLAVSRTNSSVELEHWLLKLCEITDGDIPKIARAFEMDLSRAMREITAAIERFKTGSGRTPALSDDIIGAIKAAWVPATIELGLSRIRSGALLAGILGDDKLGPQLKEETNQFAKINLETLIKEFHKIVSGSREDAEESVAATTSAAGAPEPGRVTAGSKTPNLDQYCNDLTAAAKAGKMDPVLGRDFEIRQVIDILTRRRQNNPIMVGEAGVGKTAVVEGFALRIAAGDVPEKLKGIKLLELDLTLLQAGAGVKGEFENRLKNVIAEVKASPIPIVLFIDEAHNMVGAGGQSGQGDAANLLKPALARGELRTIAATTWAEYRRYFEKDAALARRFQPVKVDEPDEKAGIIMMRGVAGKFEKHHGVSILEEAVQDSVRLSMRYIQGRQLPDKSVSLLDTACAKVAMSQHATPAAIEELRRRIDALNIEIGVLTREKAVGTDHEERLAAASKEKTDAETKLAELEKRFAEEKKLVADIGPLRKKLESAFAGSGKPGEAPAPPAAELDKMRADLGKLNARLKEIQGDLPLMSPCVDSNVIAAVISGFTGIPVGKMVTDEIKAVLNLDKELGKRVVGQDHALREIAHNIRTSRAKLGDQRKPIGVFLLCGPSGVGKTETAIALADLLYGGERNMVVINMSEYKEEHSVSNLKGSSKGLVGYGEGGVLTNAVRQKPYSVVLLDEIEKAHKQVHEIFFQVFDKGMMEDSEAREVDFKNTVILLTCNVGTDLIMKMCADPETAPDPSALATALRPELLKVFPPALLGRLSVVPYFPLSDSVMKNITKLQLGRIARRVAENHRASFTYDDVLVETIVGRCKEVESGARNIEHILNRTLLPELAAEVLGKMAAGERIGKVHVSIGGQGAFQYSVS